MTFVDTSTPAVILNAITHGSLGIVRSLGRLGVPVYALHSASGHPPACYSRYCRKSSRWSFGTACTEDVVQELLRLASELDRPSLLIPTCEETALWVAEQRHRLSRWFICPALSPELVRDASSKERLYLLARQCGAPTPEARFPQSRDELEQLAEAATFPLVLKAIDGAILQRRKGRRLVVVHNARELVEQYNALEDVANPNLMVQEFIPGGDESAWIFHACLGRNSECLVAFTGRKLREYPVHGGSTTLGICEPNPALEDTARSLLKKVGYRGPVDMDYRYDARDQAYKLLDFNPRLGANFRMFVDEHGMDVARAMYLDMTGQPVTPALPRYGRKWLVEFNDLLSSARSLRNGELTFRQWLASFRGVEEASYFARDDLRPFVRMFSTLAARIVRRLAGLSPSPSATPPSTQPLELPAHPIDRRR